MAEHRATVREYDSARDVVVLEVESFGLVERQLAGGVYRGWHGGLLLQPRDYPLRDLPVPEVGERVSFHGPDDPLADEYNEAVAA